MKRLIEKRRLSCERIRNRAADLRTIGSVLLPIDEMWRTYYAIPPRHPARRAARRRELRKARAFKIILPDGSPNLEGLNRLLSGS